MRLKRSDFLAVAAFSCMDVMQAMHTMHTMPIGLGMLCVTGMGVMLGPTTMTAVAVAADAGRNAALDGTRDGAGKDGAANDSERKEDGRKAAGKEDKDEKKDAAEKKGPPVCMHCGTTCRLAPICVCEAGTKKRSRVEFETEREPVCIAGCGGHAPRPGCTDCVAQPCACPGRVTIVNRLRAETVNEEVPTVVHKVRYVCRCCAMRTSGSQPTGWPWLSPEWWCRRWPFSGAAGH